MEIKPIEGFDDYYVCNSGVNEQTVLSTKGAMKWLSPFANKDGYKDVHLCKDGKMHTKKVHRLVAEAFIPNPEGKPCIDHINGVRDDNRVENLRWCTQKENSNNPVTRKSLSEAQKGEKNPMYGKHHSEEVKEKMSEKRKGRKPHWLLKPVEQWSKDGTTLIARYESVREAARQTCINIANISACCLGKRKSAGGYKWRYAS